VRNRAGFCTKWNKWVYITFALARVEVFRRLTASGAAAAARLHHRSEGPVPWRTVDAQVQEAARFFNEAAALDDEKDIVRR